MKRLMSSVLLLISSMVVISAQTIDATSAIKRGNELVAKEKFAEAIEIYQTIPSDADEAYAQALYNIGVCNYELSRTEQAVRFYRRALEETGGKYARASYALGVALEELGRLDEAKRAFRQAFNVSHAKFAPATYRLGLMSANEGDFETAAILFKRAATTEGQHVAASHNNLGVMLALMGQPNMAEKEFLIALRQTDGRFPDASHNLKLCRAMRQTAVNTKTEGYRLYP
jgi:tetratricopeptide (TPR) repeat protein